MQERVPRGRIAARARHRAKGAWRQTRGIERRCREQPSGKAKAFGMNSYSRVTFGSVSQRYFERLLGIRPFGPGFKTIEIEPHIEGATWAKGSYYSMYGPIRCEWNRENGFTMTVEIPANTSAVIVLPEGYTMDYREFGETVERDGGEQAFKVGAGKYTFVAKK